MPVTTAETPAHKAVTFPLYRTFPGFLRDPLAEIERIGKAADGRILRLNLGAARPLVLTHPDHVQHVLRERPDIYRRDGMYWRPLHDLFGDGVLGEGADWAASRSTLQPVFTARNVQALTARMAETINSAVDALGERARGGRQVQVLAEMGRIVNQTVIKIFFGDKITPPEAGQLADAFEVIATSLVYRFLLPFVPGVVPLPRDRAYRRGVRVVDERMYELVRRYRQQPGEGHDIFTALCQAHSGRRAEPAERWIRDNLVAMFATSTETTNVALTWLWPLLDRNPEVAARLYTEIEDVVGADRVGPQHLPGLTYTRQVVQELLRLYPVGWLFPRVAIESGRLDGVPIKAGQPLLLSPYLTHRLESVWDRPLDFDPGRFSADRSARRHRYAYFPFGGGPHQCIGMHVFNVEAQLVIAAILSRFRPEPAPIETARPQIGPSMRPKQRLTMALRPVEHGR